MIRDRDLVQAERPPEREIESAATGKFRAVRIRLFMHRSLFLGMRPHRATEDGAAFCSAGRRCSQWLPH
jgi:hypothetical protein